MNQPEPANNRTSYPGCLNDAAAALLADHDLLAELDIHRSAVAGATVLDFATQRLGTPAAGLLLSQVCLGNAAKISIVGDGVSDPPTGVLGPADHEPSAAADDPLEELGLDSVLVATDLPLAACMGAQYAGWPISSQAFFAMGSGPMRMYRGREAVLDEYGLVGSWSAGQSVVGVLESNQLPDAETIQLIASECGAAAADLILCVARTASLPGSIQVVARSVETTLHKLHELEFDLSTIVRGCGRAPLPPIADNDMTALGWTNDAILYGAKVELTVETSDAAVDSILERLPSCSSAEFGTPFLDIFNRFEKDFYKIDKLLFSPAEVVIVNTRTGRTVTAGRRRADVLRQSFGLN